MDTLLQRFYYRLRDWASKPGEKGMRHAGYWQGKVRDRALEMCRYATGRLLEIGSGQGLFLAAFLGKNQQAEVWGLDSGREMVRAAEENVSFREHSGRFHFVMGQAEQLPFEKEFFDVVVAINLFMCLPGLEKARAVVQEAARVLKPGGRLIVEFRNKANFFLRIKYKLAKYYDGTLEGNPLSTYGIDEIKAALILAGFDVEAEYYMESLVKRIAPIVMLEAKKRA